MALRGCISLRCLPLQILLADNPGWKGTPVAVTREEKPQSPILALNREARKKGLMVGVRYASALSLVPGLRARQVPKERIEEARTRVLGLLSRFTPDIEPCPFDHDALWVSVEGLRSLYETEAKWVREVRHALSSEGFWATIVVGFTRFGTYAIARSGPRCAVFATREEESRLMGRSPIGILPLPQKVLGILRKLDVRTVEQFASLPRGETERRLGKEAARLREAILSDDPLPIQSLALKERVPCRRRVDAALIDLPLLLTHIGELLAVEVNRADAEGSVISTLAIILRTEDGEVSTDLIRPAAPTRNAEVLLRLIQLRLAARRLASGVQDIEIRSDRTRPSRQQEELFDARARDLQAGARAFAAIRARFGNESVMWAGPADSYLPERSFRWVTLLRPGSPSSRPEGVDGLPGVVRRILFSPRASRSPLTGEREGSGPLVVNGFWWNEAGQDGPVHREYRFNDTRESVQWLYLDRTTGTTWLQGTVD